MERTSSVLIIALFSFFFLCFPLQAFADPCCGVECDDGDPCTDDSCVVVNDEPVCEYVDNGTCCPPADPKTQGYWVHQCRALGLIGRSMGSPRLHEEWMATWEETEDVCEDLDADCTPIVP